ncbi:NAD(P)-binding protein [Stipitochalara longipes BDJ]|nr:NAD(P)-binding protein [Stipitochalara longipes BDJ]
MAFLARNKTALVTGGGSGICLAFTKLLLSHDCNVLIADLQLTPEAKELVAANNAKSGPRRAVFKQTDVTDWKQLQAAFDATLEEFGALDIVCPGAGIFDPPWSNFWNFKDTINTVEPNSYKTLEINITHPIRATQLAINHFKKEKKGGAVVLLSSIAAQLPLLPIPLYAASKAALSSFTRSMAALEPKYGIRINAVAPGVVKTPIWLENALTWVDENVDTWIGTERVAEVMLQLIENEEYVGGTVLEVGSEALRKVEVLNDPGVGSEKGCTVANIAKGYADTFETIEEQFGRE